MAKIYISYSRTDSDVAHSIAIGLRELNHEVILAHDSITPGQEWKTVLNQALQSSDAFVSVLSSNSVSSQYVLTELGAAQALRQTYKKMLVIPVLLDKMEIPPVVQDIQVLFSPDHNVAEIIQLINTAISSFIGRRAVEEKQESEVKSRVESNAAAYIDEAITSLQNHEKHNRKNGSIWYYIGYITLIFGVGFGFYSISQFANTTDQQWIHFAYLGLKSIIVVGLLIACSKYAFTLGKSYMSEALKNADRIHAISFGKFYLRAFTDKAGWAELKEVFQHWNIDKTSAFSTLDTSQFDPKFLEAFVEVSKALAAKTDSKK